MRRSPSGIRNGPSVTRLAALTIVIVLGCWTALETHLSSRASRAANDKATTHAEIAQSIAAAELEVPLQISSSQASSSGRECFSVSLLRTLGLSSYPSLCSLKRHSMLI